MTRSDSSFEIEFESRAVKCDLSMAHGGGTPMQVVCSRPFHL
jgi:hypothetical protein